MEKALVQNFDLLCIVQIGVCLVGFVCVVFIVLKKGKINKVEFRNHLNKRGVAENP